jgi:hypothetical protein
MPPNIVNPLRRKKGTNAVAVGATPALATSVRFDQDTMRVELSDGREISAPLEWFPRLRNASDQQRAKWTLIGKGLGIHWEDVDEDLSVAGLLGAE